MGHLVVAPHHRRHQHGRPVHVPEGAGECGHSAFTTKPIVVIVRPSLNSPNWWSENTAQNVIEHPLACCREYQTGTSTGTIETSKNCKYDAFRKCSMHKIRCIKNARDRCGADALAAGEQLLEQVLLRFFHWSDELIELEPFGAMSSTLRDREEKRDAHKRVHVRKFDAGGCLPKVEEGLAHLSYLSSHGGGQQRRRIARARAMMTEGGTERQQ